MLQLKEAIRAEMFLISWFAVSLKSNDGKLELARINYT
jgi:hypothetical protein